jgi:hypothetical protein
VFLNTRISKRAIPEVPRSRDIRRCVKIRYFLEFQGGAQILHPEQRVLSHWLSVLNAHDPDVLLIDLILLVMLY